uniref:Piwi domain-containing protein n=1 Tax=Parastrongyloides trichosuri TaxID=131310 RepID=A0A0N4ZI48_PARTI
MSVFNAMIKIKYYHTVHNCPNDPAEQQKAAKANKVKKCKAVGHTKDLVAFYSPHVSWTYNAGPGIRLPKQAASKSEAIKNMETAIMEIIHKVQRNIAPNSMLKESNFVGIDTDTKVANIFYHLKPPTCESIECVPIKSVFWGSDSNSISININKPATGSVGKSLYYLDDEHTNVHTGSTCLGNGTNSMTGEVLWLPFRFRVSFVKNSQLRRMCVQHWNKIKNRVRANLNKKYLIKDMNWEDPKILIGKYSPHIKFTYQRNDTLRISGQPSTRDEANDNLTGAINRAVQRIKNSIAPKVEVVPVQLLTNSEIGEFPLHRNGNKFTKVTCFPFGDIKWGSVKDSLRIIIEKSSIQEATLPQVIYTCNADPNCKDIGFEKTLYGRYNPRLEWTYPTNAHEVVDGQALAQPRAKENLRKAMRRAVEKVKRSMNNKIEVGDVKIDSGTEIGGFIFSKERTETTGTKVTCVPYADVLWGSTGDTLKVIIEKSTGSTKTIRPDYVIENDRVYKYTNNNNKEKVWLDFAVRIEFEKGPEMPKMCDAHWNHIIEKLENQLRGDIDVNGLTYNNRPSGGGSRPSGGGSSSGGGRGSGGGRSSGGNGKGSSDRGKGGRKCDHGIIGHHDCHHGPAPVRIPRPAPIRMPKPAPIRMGGGGGGGCRGGGRGRH